MTEDTPIYAGTIQYYVRVRVLEIQKHFGKLNTLYSSGAFLLSIHPREIKTYSQKLHKNVHMVWRVECSHHGILFSNKKEWAVMGCGSGVECFLSMQKAVPSLVLQVKTQWV